MSTNRDFLNKHLNNFYEMLKRITPNENKKEVDKYNWKANENIIYAKKELEQYKSDFMKPAIMLFDKLNIDKNEYKEELIKTSKYFNLLIDIFE